MERVLDPPAVSALLGMVVSLKSKLSVLAIPQVVFLRYIEVNLALIHRPKGPQRSVY